MDDRRYKRDRALLIGAGLVALVALACPKPAPPVPIGPPDAADAARPPKKVSCAAACKHAEAVCMGSENVCLSGCTKVSSNDPGFAPCVVAVPPGPNACPALSACDALSRASR